MRIEGQNKAERKLKQMELKTRSTRAGLREVGKDFGEYSKKKWENIKGSIKMPSMPNTGFMKSFRKGQEKVGKASS